MSHAEMHGQAERTDRGREMLLGAAAASVVLLLLAGLTNRVLYSALAAFGWLLLTAWTFGRPSRRDRAFAATALALAVAATAALALLIA